MNLADMISLSRRLPEPNNPDYLIKAAQKTTKHKRWKKGLLKGKK